MKTSDVTRMIAEMKKIRNPIYDTNLCKEILLSSPIQPIQEGKYKFSRARWYQAYFEEKHYWEVEAWCTEQFGPHPRRPDAWSRWWHKFESSILFRDQEDYMMFVLRWGIQ